MPGLQRAVLTVSALLAVGLPLLLVPDPIIAGFATWLGILLSGLAALPRGARLRPCLALLAVWILAATLLTHWTAQGWQQPDADSLGTSLAFLLPALLPAAFCLGLRILGNGLARRRRPGAAP